MARSKWKDNPEACIAQAKKYNTKKEFYRADRSAYDYCKKYDLEDAAFSHFPKYGIDYGNVYRLCVYIIRHKNLRYIGVTCNYQKRINSHRQMRNDIPRNFISRKITAYICADEALDLEMRLISIYSKNKNIKLLNKSMGGDYNAKPKEYSRNATLQICKKYNSAADMLRGDGKAYRVMLRVFTSDERKKIFPTRKGSPNYSLKECEVLNEAKKYNSPSKFLKGSRKAYYSAVDLGVMDRCCEHMPEGRKPAGYWTRERLCDAAASCSTRKIFRQKYSAAYSLASSKGILQSVCEHIEEGVSA